MNNLVKLLNIKNILKKKKNSSLKSKFRTFLKKIKKINFFEKNFNFLYKSFLKTLNSACFKKVLKKKKIFRLISNLNFFLKKRYFQELSNLY